MSAENVHRLLVVSLSSLYTRSATQERNPMNAMSVRKPLLTNLVQFSIRELMPERNPMNVINVRKPSLVSYMPLSERIHTGERPYGCKEMWNNFLSEV